MPRYVANQFPVGIPICHSTALIDIHKVRNRCVGRIGVRRTMSILPRRLSGAEVSEYFGQVKKPFKEVSSTFKRHLEVQRGSLFDGYYEKHRDTELLFCRSTGGVAVVFCPSDHSGVWA